MSAIFNTVQFTITPSVVSEADFSAVVEQFAGQLLAEQRVYDWNGDIENALRDAELPEEVAQVAEEDYDDVLNLHVIKEQLQEGFVWVKHQRDGFPEVDIPGSANKVILAGGEDNGEGPFPGYSQVSLLVEVADAIPAFGEALGILGSGVVLDR